MPSKRVPGPLLREHFQGPSLQGLNCCGNRSILLEQQHDLRPLSWLSPRCGTPTPTTQNNVADHDAHSQPRPLAIAGKKDNVNGDCQSEIRLECKTLRCSLMSDVHSPLASSTVPAMTTKPQNTVKCCF